MILKILSFILWWAVWCMLSWPVNFQDMVLGALVSLFVTFMTVDTFEAVRGPSGSRDKGLSGIFTAVKRIPWFICYVLLFVWECLKANIDVAYRVLHPDMPIRPGTIKVKTTLRSDAGLTFLANSITLTPGTTTVDIDKERGFIYIHWLYVREDYDRSANRLAIVDKFERILKRIFE